MNDKNSTRKKDATLKKKIILGYRIRVLQQVVENVCWLSERLIKWI